MKRPNWIFSLLFFCFALTGYSQTYPALVNSSDALAILNFEINSVESTLKFNPPSDPQVLARLETKLRIAKYALKSITETIIPGNTDYALNNAYLNVVARDQGWGDSDALANLRRNLFSSEFNELVDLLKK